MENNPKFDSIRLFFIFTLMFLPSTTLAQFSGGNGSLGDPYLISQNTDLVNLSNNFTYWDDHFKLTANLDMTGINFIPIGNNFFQFSGTFNGNEKTISNLQINMPNSDNIGLFGYVGNNYGPNAIYDLGLINPNITGSDHVGSLIGSILNKGVKNCYSEGANVTGNRFVGGLVGSGSNLFQCYSTGNVNGQVNVGGFSGFGSNLSQCFSTGNVVGQENVGGLSGKAFNVNNCYSKSHVSGSLRVGGLIGWNNSASPTSNCYATGVVSSGTATGGLTGFNNYGNGPTNFWDMNTSGQSTSTGSGISIGWGITTNQMQTASTFIGWNCSEEIWKINEGLDSPRFIWEDTPGTNLPTSYQYSGGSGTSEDPYLISNENDLEALSRIPCDWNQYFQLIQDIDLSGLFFCPIGDSETPFTGQFDGGNHTISGLQINGGPNGRYTGLFSYAFNTNDDYVIHDLGLIEPNVMGDQTTGALVGYLKGNITYCYTEQGHVNGERNTGGLIGSCFLSTVTNCYTTGFVNGKENSGGLIGYAYPDFTIQNCYSEAHIINFTNDKNTGGLIGFIDRDTYGNGLIKNCYATGNITGQSIIGGLVGYNEGAIILNSYALGDVSGEYFIGGLIGRLNDKTVINCYSTGQVLGNSSYGGLIGDGSDRPIVNSFWNIESSGQLTSSGGIGKTTDQLQTAETFVGWNCNEVIWTINEGTEYPQLYWEENTGDPTPFFEFSDGTGSLEDPYQITEPNHILYLSLYDCHCDKHFKLINDINMLNISLTPICGNDVPFTGSFNGNNQEIQNVSIRYYESFFDGVGLFGNVDNSIYEKGIYNLGLVDPNMEGDTKTGGLVGLLNSGNIDHCYSIGGQIRGNQSVGGLVGENDNQSTVSNCYSTSHIIGNSSTGGLVGRNYNNSMVINCYASGDVTGAWIVGGLVGYNSNNSSINQSYSNNNVTGTSYSIGGLVGYNHQNSTVSNCYSNSNVFGNDKTGGLVGSNLVNSEIINCFAVGSVFSNNNPGGVLGENNYQSFILNCFWDIETSGILTGVGNENPDPVGVAGKTTSELQMKSTFTSAGWDFTDEIANGTDDLWKICADGLTYPKLSWETIPGDFACPFGVDLMDLSTLVDVWLLKSLQYDVNPEGGDGIVTMADFALLTTQHPNEFQAFSKEWLQPGTPLKDISPNQGDGIFNLKDFSVLSNNWLLD